MNSYEKISKGVREYLEDNSKLLKKRDREIILSSFIDVFSYIGGFNAEKEAHRLRFSTDPPKTDKIICREFTRWWKRSKFTR
jgi:hypothetical protein